MLDMQNYRLIRKGQKSNQKYVFCHAGLTEANHRFLLKSRCCDAKLRMHAKYCQHLIIKLLTIIDHDSIWPSFCKTVTPMTTQPAFNEDEVLRQIENAVLDHRLAPGTKLKEVELATLFGVKRGTIRKVLSRLAHAKLVEQLPNKGATVAKPTVKEGRDLFAARRYIEAAILETIIDNRTDKTISALRSLLAKEAAAYEANDPDKALSLSLKFHRELATLAGNTVLSDFLLDITHRSPLVILTHLGDDTDNRCRNQEHVEIVDAIEQGDKAKAVAVMNQHLLHIENRIADKPVKEARKLSDVLGV